VVIDLSAGVVVMLDCNTAKQVKACLGDSETITDFISCAVDRECQERDQLRARGDLPEGATNHASP
jgi:hypothetical protein